MMHKHAFQMLLIAGLVMALGACSEKETKEETAPEEAGAEAKEEAATEEGKEAPSEGEAKADKAGTDEAKPIQPRAPKKEKPEAYFLDSDSSSSLGNVDYMRESKTIRRTFPGTVDSPGSKERVIEVAAETEQLTKRTEGLGGAVKQEESTTLTTGIPKPVKKTFAEQVSTEEPSWRRGRCRM